MKKLFFYCALAIGFTFVSLATSCRARSTSAAATHISPAGKPATSELPVPAENTPVHPPTSDKVTSSSTFSPAGTPVPASWKTYQLPDSGISLRYPENWLAESSNRYAGQDGFFEISIADYAETVFGNLRTMCTLQANLHKPDLYGDFPLVFDWHGWSPEAQTSFGDGCGGFPSPDAPNSGEAVLFARYSSDLHKNSVLVLRGDAAHFMGLASTLRMAEYATPTRSSGNYTSTLCVLTSAKELPEVSQFADLTITGYPIVDAACNPYDHFDSFQSRLQAIDVKMGDQRLYIRDTRQADNSNQIQVGQDSISWKFSRKHLFRVGAPSQLDVLRNGQVIYSFAIPQQDPGGGPVKALWSWNNQWILEVENIVIVDGEIQNSKLGYEEMFEWHIVNNHPFYFFRQNDIFGFVYNGEVAPVQYDELIHGFLCCDPGLYSVQTDMLGARFYAKRDGVWWYLIIEKSLD
jgi:hypothetical protein